MVKRGPYKFPLSSLEKEIYSFLARNPKPATINEISFGLKRPVESINRSVNHLFWKNFVIFDKKYPKLISPLPPEIGVSNFLNDLALFLPSFSPLFLPNRNLYHLTGKKLFGEAGRQVSSIVSGTGDLDPDFFMTMVDKVKRGLVYRLIVLKLDQSNLEKLNYWKQNNFQIRHLKGQGINLAIYDSSVVQIGYRLMGNSREKCGIVIKNQTLAVFMEDFFNHHWKKAKPI